MLVQIRKKNQKKIIDEDEIDIEIDEQIMDLKSEAELVYDPNKTESLFDGIDDEFNIDEKEVNLEIDDVIVEDEKDVPSLLNKFEVEESVIDKKSNKEKFSSEDDTLSFDEILEVEIENIHQNKQLDNFPVNKTDDETNISDENILEIAEEIKEIIKEPQILSKVDFDEEESDQSKKNKRVEQEIEKVEEEIEIFNFFTTKETMKIISVVFNQDSVDFVNTLERIAECKNNEQGNEILKSVFTSYKLNPFSSKEAKMLQEKVEQFFRHKCL